MVVLVSALGSRTPFAVLLFVDRADRRIKRIVRTPAGETAVGEFQRELVRASSLAQLSPKGRRALLKALLEVQKPKG